MSKYFQVGDVTLWNPSHGVANLFYAQSVAMQTIAGVPSGIAADNGLDEHDVDVPVFTAFVGALVARYRSSNHPVLLALIEGFTATALVMADRAGVRVDALHGPVGPNVSDISLVGPRAGDDASRARLLELAESLSYGMPR
ncbi:DUF6086 family protein [Dactylosporangium sp. NPDC049525]|uniref:DUF6086 family protein n=1 Tax=Dactylosporangium sp. NPDC049525 TaxID=3154730 RepID=UPI0034256B0B